VLGRANLAQQALILNDAVPPKKTHCACFAWVVQVAKNYLAASSSWLAYLIRLLSSQDGFPYGIRRHG
jgi:hypothetical protein